MRVTPMPQILKTQPALVIFGQKPRMRVVASLRHFLQEHSPRLSRSFNFRHFISGIEIARHVARGKATPTDPMAGLS